MAINPTSHAFRITSYNVCYTKLLRREPLLQSIRLDELFDKTVTLMDTDFSKRKIQFTRPGTTNIEIEADPDLLLQVLMNLLKNSINATEADGRIRLSCREDDHHVSYNFV